MIVWGAVLGGAANGIANAKIDNKQLTDLLARLGGSTALVDAYLAAVIGITGLVVAAYTVQTTLRLRAEETAGRLEPLLATQAGRIAMGGQPPDLRGARYGAAARGDRCRRPDSRTARRSTTSAARPGRCSPRPWRSRRRRGYWPASASRCSASLPRLSALTWAALVACLVVLEVGEILGLSQWIVDAVAVRARAEAAGSALHRHPADLAHRGRGRARRRRPGRLPPPRHRLTLGIPAGSVGRDFRSSGARYSATARSISAATASGFDT